MVTATSTAHTVTAASSASAGRIARIVEERDASPAQRRVQEINSGIYAFDLAPLFDALRGHRGHNAQGEHYLTDLVAFYRRRKLPVETVMVDDPREIRGINTRSELAEVSAIMRQKKNEELMAAGVTIVDPATTYIDPDVEVGPDTVIHPGVVIQGHSKVGSACEIHGIRAHHRLGTGRQGDDQQLLPPRWCARCRWGDDWAVCPPAA